MYANVRGLQAFYPTTNSMGRQHTAFGSQGLDFIPLEIFLDVRSEATDYDRIVQKTDLSVSIDRFNQLRTPRGLDWPQAKNEIGQEITHLRLHRDETTVVVPRLTVSATSKHYSALYNVVTDLLLYQDPIHRKRTERIDNFTFAFDRKDSDTLRLVNDLRDLQFKIRALSRLQRGYEANVDLLDDHGKAELFRLRHDLLESTEQLYTVFEAITLNKSREEARDDMRATSKTNIRIGGVAWQMLHDDFKPLIKLYVEGTLYTWLRNKDGSDDSALAFGDLSALNSDPDALYPEVLDRYESSGTSKRRIVSHCCEFGTAVRSELNFLQKAPFASASWSILAPVGGITIVRHLGVQVHPVHFRLEERTGHNIMDYMFSDRVERRKARKSKDGAKSKSDAARDKHTKDPSTTDSVPLSRSRSQVSLASTLNEKAGHDEEQDDKFTMVPSKDAAEMRRRASANATFVEVIFGSTSIVLSYKVSRDICRLSSANFL